MLVIKGIARLVTRGMGTFNIPGAREVVRFESGFRKQERLASGFCKQSRLESGFCKQVRFDAPFALEDD